MLFSSVNLYIFTAKIGSKRAFSYRGFEKIGVQNGVPEGS